MKKRIMVDMSATLIHHGHIRLIKNAKNIKKDEFEVPEPNSELINDIEEEIGDEIINIVSITEKNKRNEEKANLITNTIDGLLEKYPDEESNIKNLIEDNRLN